LELRSINIEKSNETSYDYVKQKFGDESLSTFESNVEELFENGKISKTKRNKLLMKGSAIPEDFINRDLGNTQYIAKKAKEMLEEVFREVTTTTGSITSRLREDWQLVDVLQELNWKKYEALGLTYYDSNREGKQLPRIKDWTKRNDHRHHAMDALTVAFTKRNHVQYLNNLNARSDKSGSIYGIEQKELYRDDKNKLRFLPPIPLNDFRNEAKKHLENTLISFKAKNKVTTQNKNKFKSSKGEQTKIELTPRGQLHLETVYGSIKQYATEVVKVGGSFNIETINKVSKKHYRNALLKRLQEFNNDPKKAFTAKNSLDKNPLFVDEMQLYKVPEKVKLVWQETVYTIRKEINPDLKIDKVIDPKIKLILEARLKEFKNDPKKAFINLDENPIWLNKEKGINIRRVTISGVSNVIALHDKKDKDGKIMLDEKGNTIPVDFVNTGNNHHVAIYRDEKGNLQDDIQTFYAGVERSHQKISIINKNLNEWKFLFSIKQNEYFIFPNILTGFNPNEIDILDNENYQLISPNLYRVQKISKLIYGNSAVRDYVFRHHLETTLTDTKELKDITFKNIKSLQYLENVVKVRINHLGKIVQVGEY
jgi:CRISPR-associated endonuclease Csn1